MASAVPTPLSLREFLRLPEDTGDIYRELHSGMVVTKVRPKYGHISLQHRLLELVQPRLRRLGVVRMELPYIGQPGGDYRVADVAFLRRSRAEALAAGDDLRGVPELVIEVLSPSNAKAEIEHRQSFCLHNGGLEFWTVDPRRREVRVAAGDGNSIHRGDDRIPLRRLGSRGTLPVAAIFAGNPPNGHPALNRQPKTDY